MHLSEHECQDTTNDTYGNDDEDTAKSIVPKITGILGILSVFASNFMRSKGRNALLVLGIACICISMGVYFGFVYPSIREEMDKLFDKIVNSEGNLTGQAEQRLDWGAYLMFISTVLLFLLLIATGRQTTVSKSNGKG